MSMTLTQTCIIDGIISLHRREFAGPGTLADRQQRLNSMLHKAIGPTLFILWNCSKTLEYSSE